MRPLATVTATTATITNNLVLMPHPPDAGTGARRSPAATAATRRAARAQAREGWCADTQPPAIGEREPPHLDPRRLSSSAPYNSRQPLIGNVVSEVKSRRLLGAQIEIGRASCRERV